MSEEEIKKEFNKRRYNQYETIEDVTKMMVNIDIEMSKIGIKLSQYGKNREDKQYMKRTDKKGKCIQCGAESNIILNSNVYACIDCLNKIGEEQHYIYRVLNDIFDNEEEFRDILNLVISILELMKENGHEKTEHCIKSLKSFILMKNSE